MRLRIEHKTTFSYDHPISEAYTEMRLRPLDGHGQHCLSFVLTTEPRDETARYKDRFGNDVRHFDVIQPHQQLVVAAASDVLTPDQFFAPVAQISPLDEFDFLSASHYTAFNAEISAFAAAQIVSSDAQTNALALMEAVYKLVKYEKGATDVSTTAGEVLNLKHGVCQDFSHLMLAACRSQNISCRYVSGYLYNNGHTAASHAWVDVFIPNHGWISLDPTHNCPQTGQYVRVAIGRDYADVPPTRGIFVGNAKETMEVSVRVNVL